MINSLLALKYFEAFAAKDVKRLFELLDPNVTLRDWEVEISGRDHVVGKMNEIFQAFDEIEVLPLRVYRENQTIIAELYISLDRENIKVLDILEFSHDDKILAVRAFKG